jgi:hypothetical protein
MWIFFQNSFVKNDYLDMDVNSRNIPMSRVQTIWQQYPRYFAINSLKLPSSLSATRPNMLTFSNYATIPTQNYSVFIIVVSVVLYNYQYQQYQQVWLKTCGKALLLSVPESLVTNWLESFIIINTSRSGKKLVGKLDNNQYQQVWPNTCWKAY